MADSAYSAKGLTEMIYSSGEANGMIVIVFASTVSLLAEIGLLIALVVVVLRPKFRETSDYLFLQSNLGLYFVSLLLANAVAAIGSVMSIHWVVERRVEAGSFCTAQGVVKNIGNVATALWTLVIAVHVFNLLFLRHQTKRVVGIATTVAVWCGVLAIDIFGPAVLHKQDVGPFFGIAGYWCWITVKYPGARVGLEYFWFFFSGAMSFVLYVLVFLRLRGNIVVPEGTRVPKFIWVSRSKAWKLQVNRDAVDAHMTAAARQMIWFPVAHTIVIIPIAVSRFVSDAGNNVPFAWIVFGGSLFMSSGLINVILFTSIRKALPTPGILPTFNIPRKPPPSVFIPPPKSKFGSISPYVISSASSDQSFGDKDKDSQKLDDYVPEEVYMTNIGASSDVHWLSGTDSSASTVAGDGGSRRSSPSASPALRINPLPSILTEQYAPPSPPVEFRHERRSSTDSLQNPFSDSNSHAESDSEDEYDEHGKRRSEWQPSLSVYFESIDLLTPQAVDHPHVSFADSQEVYTVSTPRFPVPAMTREHTNRI